MASTSFFSSTKSQTRWRLHMYNQYNTQNQDIRPCVFQVPDNLRETKPEAYIPQILGLGPYHHFRPQVQHMSSKKRDAVHLYLKKVKSSYKGEAEVQKFQSFILSIEKISNQLHSKIRSCYDQFLDLDEKTLSWIVVVDSLVLWYFIDAALENKEPVPDGTSADEGDGSSSEGEELVLNSVSYEKIAPDIFMLENQIPAFLIVEARKVLGFTSDTELRSRFYNFCKGHSPLSLTKDTNETYEAYDPYNHILHYMYQLIMRNVGADHAAEIKPEVSHRFKAMESVAAEIYYHVVDEFTSAMEKAETAGIQVPGNIKKVSQLLQKLERTFQLQQHYNKSQVLPGDKIEIPSASRLVLVLNVQFERLPDDHGIKNIKLSKTKDGKAFVFYLPEIKMRPNSEVIIRNLVAYEATASSDQLRQGSTRLREFVDLMCGLIKSENDVQLLKDAEILNMDGLQNQQIVNMCSGISKSHEKPADDSKVYSAVKDANDHFNNTRFVKFWKKFMKVVSIMVKIFTALFPYFIVLFLGFQSACEIFDCRAGPNRMAAANLYLDGPEAKALMLPRKLLPYHNRLG